MLLAQDMDNAVAEAERKGIKGIENQIKGCFLYKYLKQKKDSTAERAVFSGEDRSEGRQDRYIDLKRAYLLRKIAGHTPESDEAYIAAYREIMKKEPPDGDIENAQSAAEDELMAGAVSDYVSRWTKTVPDRLTDDSGKTSKAKRIRVLKNVEKDPENSDILGMYCAFFGGAQSNSGGAVLSDEYRNKCVDLYIRMLCDERFDTAYMPLYIDSSSGAGVYIIGKKRFDDSALISVFLDKKGIDLNIIRKMLNHSDTPKEINKVKAVLLRSGFESDLTAELTKKHKYAAELTDKVLKDNRFNAEWREKQLNENPAYRKLILKTLKSDPQYRDKADELYNDTLYSDELMHRLLTTIGFTEEKTASILLRRKLTREDILPLFETCYPCTVRFNDLMEMASFGETSYKELDMSAAVRILVCDSVGDAFCNLSENNDWYASAYAYLNRIFPKGADECFRGRMSE